MPLGIDEERPLDRQPLCDRLLRPLRIGREKHPERRRLRNLGVELPGRPEAELGFMAGLRGEELGEVLGHGREIGRHRHIDRFGRGRKNRAAEQEEREDQAGQSGLRYVHMDISNAQNSRLRQAICSGGKIVQFARNAPRPRQWRPLWRPASPGSAPARVCRAASDARHPAPRRRGSPPPAAGPKPSLSACTSPQARL